MVEFQHPCRRAGGLEQRAGNRQRHFVVRADRDHAGDELLEDRGITLLEQLEQRGLGPWLDSLLDAGEHGADVEGLLDVGGTAHRVLAW
jgi:hypothetical protein